MLSVLFRFGPMRQRIMRGFVVTPQSPDQEVPAKIVERTLARVRTTPLHKIGDHPAQIVTDASAPHAMWIDTGMIWLHTPEARNARLGELQQAIEELSKYVAQENGILLPNAVRLRAKDPWSRYLVGDRHFLEVSNEIELAVAANLLREYVPELVALSGRAGADIDAVEQTASRRLSDSAQHFAARYLDSVSERYLTVFGQELKREHGVRNIGLLDVVPRRDSLCVELRFPDGQVMLSSVRAQSLIYEALLIKSRRQAHLVQCVESIEGVRIEDKTAGDLSRPVDELEFDERSEDSPRYFRRICPTSQAALESNRSKAIANGLNGTWRIEYVEVDASGLRNGSDEGRVAPSGRRRWEVVRATDAIRAMLESLADEYRMLRIQYDELAPVILGLALDQKWPRMDRTSTPDGAGAPPRIRPLRNENDWLEFQQLSIRKNQNVNALRNFLAKCLTESGKSHIVKKNEGGFSSEEKDIRSFWEKQLRLNATEVDGDPSGSDEARSAAPVDPHSPGSEEKRP